MGNITKTDTEYWLEKIYEAIGTLGSVQADWTENNTSAPSYIKHKPTTGVVVAGELSGEGFKPDEGAPSYDDVLRAIGEGAVVYLKYSDGYDMVVQASDDKMQAASDIIWAK